MKVVDETNFNEHEHPLVLPPNSQPYDSQFIVDQTTSRNIQMAQHWNETFCEGMFEGDDEQDMSLSDSSNDSMGALHTGGRRVTWDEEVFIQMIDTMDPAFYEDCFYQDEDIERFSDEYYANLGRQSFLHRIAMTVSTIAKSFHNPFKLL